MTFGPLSFSEMAKDFPFHRLLVKPAENLFNPSEMAKHIALDMISCL